MWLYRMLLLHICISAYGYSGLCSSVSSLRQTMVSKVRLTVITMVLLGLYFGAFQYWVINLSLKHQKESREKNCGAFHFFPLRTDSDKGFTFLNCPRWSSMSFLIRTPQSLGYSSLMQGRSKRVGSDNTEYDFLLRAHLWVYLIDGVCTQLTNYEQKLVLAVKSRPSKISTRLHLEGKHLTLNVNLSRNWLSKGKLSVRFKSTHIFSSIFGILTSLKVVSSLPHKALFCSPSQQFSLFPLPSPPIPLMLQKNSLLGWDSACWVSAPNYILETTLKFPVSVLSLLDIFDTTLNTTVQTSLPLVLGKYKTYTEKAIVRAKKPLW